MQQRYEIEIAPDGEMRMEKVLWTVAEQCRERFWAQVAWPVLQLGTIDPSQIQEVIDWLRAAGCVIRRVQAVRPTLEEMFFDAVGANPSRPPPLRPLGQANKL